jgi:hypothetical protein
MLDSKELILSNIELIFKEYNKIKEEKNEGWRELMKDITELRECNNKLMTEVSEKDKLLLVNDRKMHDYEVMINQIQENAMKEITEKERFDMLKKQDKEIYERDIEIKRLQKRVDMLEDKLSLLDKKSDVDDNIIEIREEGTGEKKEDLEELNLEESVSDKKEEVVVETPVEEQEDVSDKTEEEVDVEELVEEVVETPIENHEEEVETQVVENPNDKEEGLDNGEDTEELSEEEDAEVEILTYYKKDYYLVVNEMKK